MSCGWLLDLLLQLVVITKSKVMVEVMYNKILILRRILMFS